VTPSSRSGETFYSNALQAYINRFVFDDDPLDVALRKLLMDVGLPRETQQIDRVMETFAKRYLECNRRLFISDGMSSYAVSIVAILIVIRPSLYTRLQSYHAPYRCFQQIQQTKNDEGRLYPKYKTFRRLSRGLGSERNINNAVFWY
jgi:hypothetical protein